MFEWCPQHTPQWNTISISGYHIREAGATAAQELAFTLANGFTYVERGIARGLEVDRFTPRLSFFWDIHNDFFEEIAKRSEEHTSGLQSRPHLVCRLLLAKKKK